jgi:hypothetical protein
VLQGATDELAHVLGQSRVQLGMNMAATAVHNKGAAGAEDVVGGRACWDLAPWPACLLPGCAVLAWQPAHAHMLLHHGSLKHTSICSTVHFLQHAAPEQLLASSAA